jgi:hypothetical protein
MLRTALLCLMLHQSSVIKPQSQSLKLLHDWALFLQVVVSGGVGTSGVYARLKQPQAGVPHGVGDKAWETAITAMARL